MDKFAEPLNRLADPGHSITGPGVRYELRFDSLFEIGRAFRFPCDAIGRVALDALSARQRQSLERVMNLVGRDYAAPQLVTLAG
jgi:hypothetical protein